MMMVLSSLVRRWHRILRRCLRQAEIKTPLGMLGCFGLGFIFSAASLKNSIQPFAMAVLCAGLSGWMPVPFALGSGLGYWLLWGESGAQGLVWVAASLPVCVLLAEKRTVRLLQPALAALIVAVSGIVFQLWFQQDLPLGEYLVQILLAFGASWLFVAVRSRKDTAADWVALGILVLSLAQLAPLPYLDLGIVLAAMLVTSMPFPAVAISGLALDLARITAIPMTAVLCLAYLVRLLPGKRRGLMYFAPALAYLPVMVLCGQPDLLPIPALAIGGLAGVLLPGQTPLSHRRGETGFAQVRLEMSSRVLAQTEQLLIEAKEYPIDEAALIEKSAERACGCCPCRKGCKHLTDAKQLPISLLHRPLTGAEDLPISCKKRGRLLIELRRSQDQYRILKADRERQQEYRGAVIQQYRFLAEFLQDLADSLPQRGSPGKANFRPEIGLRTQGRELSNGDRFLHFAGTDCKYYLLLCDGMGTGMGAAEEAGIAAGMLKRLLMAGFPAAYALRSINNLCTLRGRAGAVTMDLAELQLDCGRATVYKWGAAPSYLLVPTGPERIGSYGAPPGLSVMDTKESVDRLSLRRGEVLVLLSDGVQAETAMDGIRGLPTESAGRLAGRILELGKGDGGDDATVAVVRLNTSA